MKVQKYETLSLRHTAYNQIRFLIVSLSIEAEEPENEKKGMNVNEDKDEKANDSDACSRFNGNGTYFRLQ